MSKFSFDTIKNFDRHIESSIPRYSDIHACIDGILGYFVKDDARIFDIGCSTGKMLKRIDAAYANKRLELIGYDTAENLLPKNSGKCSFRNVDILSDRAVIINADIVFCLFTMCFIPLKLRAALMKKIYSGLVDGGIFICAEKLYAESPKMQNVFTFLYYDFKMKSFNEKEILSKEKDLREIQEPLSASKNEEMFRSVGFSTVEMFWKYYSFAAWVCVK